MEERGEEVGPDVALEVGIYEVTAVNGAADGGRGQVFGGGGGGGGGRWVDEFFGGEWTVHAVGYCDGGVTLAAMTRFYEAATIV